MIKILVRLALAACCFSSTINAAESSTPGSGELKPLWELGFGAGVLNAPGYPSSSETQVRGLALPYVIYRGDVLRIGDGQSVRAVAFDSDRVELDLSFAASFDSDTEAGELRDGMPDLDYLFQLGPQMRIELSETTFADQSVGTLTLALQARGMFSTDLGSINHHGYVFEPMLQYEHVGFLSPNLEATFSLKPQWATRQLHQYFFEVQPEFATPVRAAYRADGGYFGTGLNLYGRYHISEKLNIFFGVQMMSYHGAANRASPLFEKDFTFGFGAGFILKLFESERMVLVD